MVIDLAKESSILNQYMSELRDSGVQQDSMRFRKNLERIGSLIAYEISKKLEYETREVTTPLGIAKVSVLKQQPVLATILRAGLPMHQGMLEVFDKAHNSFVSAYRKHHKDGSFEIQIEYLSSPDIKDKVVILSDPMLASGGSIVLAYQALLQRGTPLHTHIVTVISSVEGLKHVQSHLPENVTIWTAGVDDELTAQSYIVPGLGDAGDLAYGNKI